MRATQLICLTVLISHASFGSEMEAELVQEIQDPEAPVTQQVDYSAVPGFALQQGATSVAGKDKDGCAAICTGEPTCRSFSYDPKTKQCFWSVDSLNFDPAFVMMTKAHHSADVHKKYRTFNGLTYRAKGWLKVTGKSLEECEDLCTKSTTCEALSYREDDMLCLLSPKGVHYAADFTYYEKTGAKIATMPISKEGGAKLPSDEAEEEPSQEQTNQEEVTALMNAEQQKLENANEEITAANEMEQKSKAAVSNEETEAHNEIAAAQRDAAAQLQKDESKFAKAQSEKMAQEESTLKLQFASAELKEKAQAEEASSERQKQRTEAAAADVKEHAAREAARAVAEGAEQAAARVEKAQLEEKANQAQQEMQDAEEKTQKAKLEKQNAVDEVEATKEVAEKKTAAADKEIEEKKAALEGKSEAEKEKGFKEIGEAKQKATAEARERTIEIEQKETKRNNERNEKAKEETEEDEKQNKKVLAGTLAERKKDEEAKEAEDEKLAQMEKESMLAKVQANQAEVQTSIATEQQKLDAQKALNEQQMDFQKKELAEQIRSKMEREAAAEVEQQRENVAREAARRVAEASKEEADRIAQEAVDAQKRKELEEKDKVNNLEEQVNGEKKAEEAKTEAEKDEIEKKIADEKAQTEKQATEIEDEAKKEAKTIEEAAAADAKAKKDKAEAEASLTEAKAKEMGEKQAADIAEAADQASLITTMTVKADEASFVSSGLNPGSESYQDLENNAKSANDNADEEKQKATAAKEAADEASAQVAAAESKGKELAEKSASAAASSAQSAANNAAVAANSAAAQAAAQSIAAGGISRRLLATAHSQHRENSIVKDDLNQRLRAARQRAVRAMRRLLQTSGTDPTNDVANQIAATTASATQAAQQASANAEQLAGQTSEASTKAGVAAQMQINANAANNAQNAVVATANANAAADAQAAKTQEIRQKSETQSAEMDAKATHSAAASAAQNAQAAAETQQAALNAANLLPANTAYGKLPEMFEHKGYLRIQSGGPMEQSAYIKFPVSQIPATDTIIGATMRLFKTGGGGGPALIKLASCSWTRNTLTYSSSETLPQATVSEGVTSQFPEESDMWAAVQLKAAAIQSARANGDHLCFEVTGGPKDEPVIVSSELTSKQPELKIELQKPPKTEEEKKAEAEKQAALERKLAAENDMEDHLKSKYLSEEKAAALKDKAAALPTIVNEIKAEGTKKMQEATQGDAFKVLSSEKEAAQNQEISEEIAEKSTAIETEENEKMGTTLVDSGLIGAERDTLRQRLETETSTAIATKIAAMKVKVESEVKAKYMDELSSSLEDKKASIENETAEKIQKATQEAATLTDAEMQAVDAKVDGRVAQGMTDWKAGKLVDPEAPASVHQAAAETAQNELDMAGMTETDKAATEAKVAQEVENALPALLNTRVQGKMQEAENNAIAEIKTKLQTDSDTKMQADIARETAGKDATETAKIKLEITQAAGDKLKTDIAAATTSSALVALKAKLQSDLTEQLRPSVEAELKAKITRQQVAAAQKAKAEEQADKVEAVVSAGGTTSSGDKGGTNSTSTSPNAELLDLAESFGNTARASVIEGSTH